MPDRPIPKSPRAARIRALALLALPALAAGACDRGAGGDSAAGAPKIAPWRAELLDRAFAVASAIPVDPHARDRAKAQEGVAEVCVRLGDFGRAADFASRIGNWRRGTALAGLAIACARKGLPDEARRHVAEAEKVANETGDWRRERIRSGVAEANRLLEDAPAPEIDARLAALDLSAAAADPDAGRGMVSAYASLLDETRDDETNARNAMIEAKLRADMESLHPIQRLDAYEILARNRKARGDAEGALALARETLAFVRGREWPIETRVALLARAARVLGDAGSAAEARTTADEALEAYREGESAIADIWRAGALRPIALTEAALGDGARSLSVHRLALEAGALNPNSRPRAEDLAATCASIAEAGAEPDAEILARIEAIAASLGDPW